IVKGGDGMKRKAEFILGLIGGCVFTLVGVIDLLGAVFYGSGSLGALAYGQGRSFVISSALIVFLLALLGLAGALFVNRKDTLSGIFMMVSGVMGLASSGFPWSALWSVPLIVAGVMACVPKSEKQLGQNMTL